MEAVLFGMGIALLPIYAFESGSVQYAHIILLIFVLMRLAHQSIKLSLAERLLFLLVIVVFTREGIAAATGLAPPNSLVHAAYLAFNTAIVIAVARIPLQDRLFRISLKQSLAASVAISVGGIWYYGTSITFTGGVLQRSIGLFNNPNQLGYFAVCLTSITGLLYLRGMMSRTACLLFWSAATFLVIVSLSRAAVMGLMPAVIMGLAAFLNKDRLSPMVFTALLVLITGVWLSYAGGLLDDFQFVERLRGTGSDRYDSLADRGYSLDFDGPVEFLFGSGAALARIGSYGQHEVHSTLWSFMAKYGLLGFGLFAGVWMIWAKRIFRHNGILGVFVVIVPALLFGLTHNGSRFTAFWVLIGLSLNPSLRAIGQRSPSNPASPNYPPAAGRATTIGPSITLTPPRAANPAGQR